MSRSSRSQLLRRAAADPAVYDEVEHQHLPAAGTPREDFTLAQKIHNTVYRHISLDRVDHSDVPNGALKAQLEKALGLTTARADLSDSEKAAKIEFLKTQIEAIENQDSFWYRTKTAFFNFFNRGYALWSVVDITRHIAFAIMDDPLLRRNAFRELFFMQNQHLLPALRKYDMSELEEVSLPPQAIKELPTLLLQAEYRLSPAKLRQALDQFNERTGSTYIALSQMEGPAILELSFQLRQEKEALESIEKPNDSVQTQLRELEEAISWIEKEQQQRDMATQPFDKVSPGTVGKIADFVGWFLKGQLGGEGVTDPYTDLTSNPVALNYHLKNLAETAGNLSAFLNKLLQSGVMSEQLESILKNKEVLLALQNDIYSHMEVMRVKSLSEDCLTHTAFVPKKIPGRTLDDGDLSAEVLKIVKERIAEDRRKEKEYLDAGQKVPDDIQDKMYLVHPLHSDHGRYDYVQLPEPFPETVIGSVSAFFYYMIPNFFRASLKAAFIEPRPSILTSAGGYLSYVLFEVVYCGISRILFGVELAISEVAIKKREEAAEGYRGLWTANIPNPINGASFEIPDALKADPEWQPITFTESESGTIGSHLKHLQDDVVSIMREASLSEAYELFNPPHQVNAEDPRVARADQAQERYGIMLAEIGVRTSHGELDKLLKFVPDSMVLRGSQKVTLPNHRLRFSDLESMNIAELMALLSAIGQRYITRKRVKVHSSVSVDIDLASHERLSPRHRYLLSGSEELLSDEAALAKFNEFSSDEKLELFSSLSEADKKNLIYHYESIAEFPDQIKKGLARLTEHEKITLIKALSDEKFHKAFGASSRQRLMDQLKETDWSPEEIILMIKNAQLLALTLKHRGYDPHWLANPSKLIEADIRVLSGERKSPYSELSAKEMQKYASIVKSFLGLDEESPFNPLSPSDFDAASLKMKDVTTDHELSLHTWISLNDNVEQWLADNKKSETAYLKEMMQKLRREIKVSIKRNVCAPIGLTFDEVKKCNLPDLISIVNQARERYGASGEAANAISQLEKYIVHRKESEHLNDAIPNTACTMGVIIKRNQNTVDSINELAQSVQQLGEGVEDPELHQLIGELTDVMERIKSPILAVSRRLEDDEEEMMDEGVSRVMDVTRGTQKLKHLCAEMKELAASRKKLAELEKTEKTNQVKLKKAEDAVSGLVQYKSLSELWKRQASIQSELRESRSGPADESTLEKISQLESEATAVQDLIAEAERIASGNAQLKAFILLRKSQKETITSLKHHQYQISQKLVANQYAEIPFDCLETKSFLDVHREFPEAFAWLLNYKRNELSKLLSRFNSGVFKAKAYSHQSIDEQAISVISEHIKREIQAIETVMNYQIDAANWFTGSATVSADAAHDLRPTEEQIWDVADSYYQASVNAGMDVTRQIATVFSSITGFSSWWAEEPQPAEPVEQGAAVAVQAEGAAQEGAVAQAEPPAQDRAPAQEGAAAEEEAPAQEEAAAEEEAPAQDEVIADEPAAKRESAEEKSGEASPSRSIRRP